MTELSREVFSFIALRTVAAATDNFSVSNELGRGGFGVVYKVKFFLQGEISLKFGIMISLVKHGSKEEVIMLTWWRERL